MSVRIVTDNCCDLPDDLITRHCIEVAYLSVRFGDSEYGPRQLTNDRFYELMSSSNVLPHTSQPSQGHLLETYQKALQGNHEVIAIHLSSAISGTVQGGLAARELLGTARLHVFDSRVASTGQGLMVLEAARMAELGAGTEEILGTFERDPPENKGSILG